VTNRLSTVLSLLLAVFFICGQVLAQTQQAIPPSFFGIQVNDVDQAGYPRFPLQVTYGNVRNWDVVHAQWPDIQSCDPHNINKCTYTWTAVDDLLAGVYQDNQTNGTNNVVEFTLALTPAWAQPPASEEPQACGNGDSQDLPPGPPPGSCYPPSDIDGPNVGDAKGPNQIWRNWVFQIASHVNAQGYTNSHAPIKYWEIWNEFDGVHGDFWAGGLNKANGVKDGTTNQLVRMAEDANCIITGRVQKITATGETCAHVLQTLTPPQTQSVDLTADIVEPSSYEPDPAAQSCFLYCNTGATGCAAINDHDQCTVNNAGANAVDILDLHYYATYSNPEGLSTTAVRNVLQSRELSKPLWIGEGSFGNSYKTTAWWQDPYAQGGFIARYFATIWAQTLPTCSGGSCPACGAPNLPAEVCQQAFWYGYDTDKKIGTTPASIGALFCAGNDNKGTICNDGGTNHAGVGLLYPPSGPAPMWKEALLWLTGATPASSGANAFCNPLSQSSTVWHCDFTNNGTSYSMAWDTKYSSRAAKDPTFCIDNFPNNPYVCGNTTYTPPGQFTRWIDLSGTVYSISSGVPFQVGLNPVLLEP
jgi:hypothetical protein